jgi:CRISPR-associated protein Cst2
MASSQHPHITDFKGVVSYTENLTPAPTISAINDDYVKEINMISKNLNIIEKDSIR